MIHTVRVSQQGAFVFVGGWGGRGPYSQKGFLFLGHGVDNIRGALLGYAHMAGEVPPTLA